MPYDVSRMKYEYKYLVPDHMRGELRRLISPFMEYDRYMELRRISGADERMLGYTVRSIYYDSPGFRYYHDKRDGLRIRKKVRIRGYNEYSDNNIVFLEVKRKVEKKIYKNRSSLLYRNLDAFISSGDVEQYILQYTDRAQPRIDAGHFLSSMKREHLVPVVLVIYEREAYFGKFDNSFRITFDKNLRSSIHPSLDQLYEERDIRHTIPGQFVLEIKFYQTFPSWMTKIVRNLDLGLQSFSKFTNCIKEHETVPELPPRQSSSFFKSQFR